MGVLTGSKKQRKTQSSAFLKVVHPRGYIEIFREPISAGEILERYPRHCITRPDFFEFPWIVVRPESVLVPGEVFFLVSHKTVDKVLKKKRQETHHRHPSNEGCCSNGREEHDSESRSLYRSSFYESWNEMQRNLLRPYDQLDSEIDSPLELQRVKSCLKKADSDRKNLNLKVKFWTNGV